MKILASAILLLWSLQLCAQSPGMDMQSLRLKVAHNPVDANARISLAYQLMLSGNSSEALNHYETLLKQDAGNVSAIEGVLWALQAQERFRESIDKAGLFLKQNPALASLYSYKAFALSQLGFHLAARSLYAQGQSLNKDEALRQRTDLGLAWEYLLLKDYPAARAKLKKLGPDSDPQAWQQLARPEYKIALGGSSNYSNLHSVNLNLALRKSMWGAELGYEELLLDGSRFRKRIQATAMWQNPVANLSVSTSTLSGKDKRIYPVESSSLTLQPTLYYKQLQIKPSAGFIYGSYQRFDIQQADARLVIASDCLSGSYGFSQLYQDNDALDSDDQRQIHSFNLGIRPLNQLWITGYLFLGDSAWWTSPYGVIYDEFEASSNTYGLSLYSPIGKAMGLLLYTQIGKQNDESELSSSITLSYRM